MDILLGYKLYPLLVKRAANCSATFTSERNNKRKFTSKDRIVIVQFLIQHQQGRKF